MSWIALKMLTGNRGKYLGIILGIAFASLLIAQQASIFCGLMLQTSGQIRDIQGASIWVMDRNVQFSDDIKPLSENDLYRVLELQHVTPGNLRGFVRIKLRNIRNGALADQKLRSEDTVERATLDERQMQYLYQDGDDYYFMDTVTFDQIHITSEALGESVNYLKAEMTISVEFYGTEPVGIELPQTVDLKVTDTAPGIKGATASAQVKPATLETGLVVQVPPFVNPGDLIRVSTDTGEYLSRA